MGDLQDRAICRAPGGVATAIATPVKVRVSLEVKVRVHSTTIYGQAIDSLMYIVIITTKVYEIQITCS